MICYAGIICEQNFMFCYEFCQDQLGKRVWKVFLLYDDVVCFLVVLDSIFETLAHIWATLRSLLNKLACLTVLDILDSIFEILAHIWATLRSLLNELACLTVSVLLSELAPLIETCEYPWYAFTNSQFDIGNSWNHAQNTPQLHSTLLVAFVYVAKAVWS